MATPRSTGLGASQGPSWHSCKALHQPAFPFQNVSEDTLQMRRLPGASSCSLALRQGGHSLGAQALSGRHAAVTCGTW